MRQKGGKNISSSDVRRIFMRDWIFELCPLPLCLMTTSLPELVQRVDTPPGQSSIAAFLYSAATLRKSHTSFS